MGATCLRRAAVAFAAMAVFLVAAGAAGPARATDDPTERVSDLDRRALGAFEDLDFEKSRSLLKEALAAIDARGLGKNPVAARTHLYLGMVLLVGFSQHDAAVEQLKMALDIQPDVAPPRGLFNPEAQRLFDETKSQRASAKPQPKAQPATEARTEAKDEAKAETKDEARTEAKTDGARADVEKTAGDEDGDEDEDEDGDRERAFVIAVGVGSGGGTATGRLDMDGVQPNHAPGRFALSETVHATLAVGYFVTEAWLVSVEGRLQLLTGATPHCSTTTDCSGTSDFALAGLVKLTRFFSTGPLQPFATLGLGGGRIRQRVELTGLPDCGRTGSEQCYDTVPGGPFFAAGGAGLAYQAGQFLIQAAVIANVGYPSFMVNVDATLGLALRL